MIHTHGRSNARRLVGNQHPHTLAVGHFVVNRMDILGVVGRFHHLVVGKADKQLETRNHDVGLVAFQIKRQIVLLAGTHLDIGNDDTHTRQISQIHRLDGHCLLGIGNGCPEAAPHRKGHDKQPERRHFRDSGMLFHNGL